MSAMPAVNNGSSCECTTHTPGARGTDNMSLFEVTSVVDGRIDRMDFVTWMTEATLGYVKASLTRRTAVLASAAPVLAAACRGA